MYQFTKEELEAIAETQKRLNAELGIVEGQEVELTDDEKIEAAQRALVAAKKLRKLFGC